MSSPAAPAVSAPSPTAHLPPFLYAFGFHNEDARVEQVLIDILIARRAAGGAAQAGLRVCSVAASGTHTLVYCASPHVGTVDTVDVSATQVMLARFTAAAATGLPTPEALAEMLGTGGDGEARLQAYHDAVRPHLAPDAVEFWDEHIATVEAGTMNCGGAERMMMEMRALMPTTDPAELRDMPDAVVAAIDGAYTLDMLGVHMPNIPRAAFERLLPTIKESAATHLNKYLATWSPSEPVNVLAHLTLTGTYPMAVPAERPLFLQPAVYAATRALGCGPDRLRFHVGPLQEVAPALAAASGGFDIIDISNIFDVLPSPALARAIADALVAALAPGGALLSRWANPPGTLPTLFRECGLEVDADVNARLFAVESFYHMTEVCVGFKP